MIEDFNEKMFVTIMYIVIIIAFILAAKLEATFPNY